MFCFFASNVCPIVDMIKAKQQGRLGDVDEMTKKLRWHSTAWGLKSLTESNDNSVLRLEFMEYIWPVDVVFPSHFAVSATSV